ncbi:DUF2971 domain-containing protein [Pseudomonadota bacterium]
MDFADKCHQVWNSSRREPPSLLYHYTDAKGLIGMCETGKMWASRYDYLNDPIEDKYGRDLIATVFRRTAEEQTNADIKKFFLSIATGYSDKAPGFESHWYIISFSEDGDDLSQWRSYADDGNGYSLGFGVNGDSGLNGEFLHPVCYNKNNQMEMIEEIAKLCIEHFKKEVVTPVLFTSAFYQIAPVLSALSITMKQPAYKAEKEWRYVWQPEKNKHHLVSFRDGERSTIIPFVESKLMGINGELDMLPIDDLILGPQRGKDQSSIDLLLRKSLNKPPHTKQSDIKYGKGSV